MKFQMSTANKETTGIIKNFYIDITHPVQNNVLIFKDNGQTKQWFYSEPICRKYMHSFSIENFTLNTGGGSNVNFVTLSLSNEMEIIAAAYFESVI